jgi:hypothetical protein
MPEPPAEEPQGYDSPGLSGWQRSFAGIAGSIAFGCGAVATFTDRNSVGCGVLVGTGALFGLLAITGDRIRRAKVGSSEVELIAPRQVVRASMDSPNAEVKKEVAEAVLESPLPRFDPLRLQAQTIAEAAVYESSVLEALIRVVPAMDLNDTGGRGLDAIAVHNGERIGIVIKYSNPRFGGHARDYLRLARNLAPEPDRILFVVNKGSIGRPQVGDKRFYEFVVWKGPEDDDSLRKALDALAAQG